MLCFKTHSQIHNCIFPSALIISVTVISPIIHAIKAATGAGKKDCDRDDKTKKKVINSCYFASVRLVSDR